MHRNLFRQLPELRFATRISNRKLSVWCSSFLLLVALQLAWPIALLAVPAKLRAGAAKVDITPDKGVSLDGPISKNGPVVGINDPLHARAIVLDDQTNRIAIVICDLCMIGRDVVDSAKEQAALRTKIPKNQILVAATHTHAAPRATHIGTSDADNQYHEQLATKIADAIAKAEENLSPAQIGFARFERPDLIACRRTLCKIGSVSPNPFGKANEQVRSVAGKSKETIGPAGPVDPEFSIVSIKHADGKPLAILGNFSAHYCGGYKRGIVSADYFGAYAKALEDRLDSGNSHPPFVGLLSNGTSGDTGAVKKVDATKKYSPYEWIRLSGTMLAEQTLKALADTTYRGDTPIQMEQYDQPMFSRQPDEKRLKWAHETLNGNLEKPVHPWVRTYAQEAIHLSKLPTPVWIQLQAIRIGDLAIAAAPCEVFAETGLAIKRESAAKHTFTIELANGYGGYLPTAKQHQLGGYETWPARSSFLRPHAEEKIRSELLRLMSKSEPRVVALSEVQRLESKDAHQGVAVDAKHFYAIASSTISKHDRSTGQPVKRWKSTNNHPLVHLNSGMVLDGKLYCAHSNWPAKPTKNSIEIWDAATLEHRGQIELIEDALACTWIDRHAGHWWIAYAGYGSTEEVSKSRVERYNDEWLKRGQWTFPPNVIAKFTPYSNSGGSFGPDGRLYATGHDRSEIYVFDPRTNDEKLLLHRTLPAPIFGQGIAWDRSGSQSLFGIRRRDSMTVELKPSWAVPSHQTKKPR